MSARSRFNKKIFYENENRFSVRLPGVCRVHVIEQRAMCRPQISWIHQEIESNPISFVNSKRHIF